MSCPTWTCLVQLILDFSKSDYSNSWFSNLFSEPKLHLYCFQYSYHGCGAYFYKPKSPDLWILYALRVILACLNSPPTLSNNSRLDCIYQQNLRHETRIISYLFVWNTASTRIVLCSNQKGWWSLFLRFESENALVNMWSGFFSIMQTV